MLNVWLGSFSNFHSIWNICCGCHLHVMNTIFLCFIMYVLGAPPHFEEVVVLGLSVKNFSSASHISSQLFSGCVISNTGILYATIPLLACAHGIALTFLDRVSPGVFDSLLPKTSRTRVTLAYTIRACGMIENMSCSTVERLVYFECVSSCWQHQLVICGIKIYSK